MTLYEAYLEGLGDGLVYGVTVMTDNEPERRRSLKEIKLKKREMQRASPPTNAPEKQV